MDTGPDCWYNYPENCFLRGLKETRISFMKNIFFDLCSIPILIVILWTCVSRKMTRGRQNRYFIIMNVLPLLCAVLDIWMEYTVYPLPLPPRAVLTGNILSTLYKWLRNGSMVVCFIFVFMASRTEERIRSPRRRLLIWAPFGLVVVLLFQNLFTGSVFTITPESGYTRGPLLAVLYVVSFCYGAVGILYSFSCRKYLPPRKWISIVFAYLLAFIGVILQLIRPRMLVELFCTSLGLLMIMLQIMRPEEAMDSSVNIRSRISFRNDLETVIRSRQEYRLLVLRLVNSAEIRTLLGDDQHDSFVRDIAQQIRQLYRKKHFYTDLYYERPDILYLLAENNPDTPESQIPELFQALSSRTLSYGNIGMHFEGRACLIHIPEDLNSSAEIIHLSHRFTDLIGPDETLVNASDLITRPDYAVLSHMEEILNRAVHEKTLEMYYQPIYDLRTRRFRSAEALARLKDPEFGIISPSLFIPAAERTGLIIPLGDSILNQVFRFIASHDMKALGLDYIEVNLSIAQCMQRTLSDTIRLLQEKYRIDPGLINFEITETTFDHISNVANDNLSRLYSMGYRLALDDYGIGYSNIQRLSKLPLKSIKVDKSMVDEMTTDNGRIIMLNTVRMMHDINKELIIEGVESREDVEALTHMTCDFIQGFYFSQPLPEEKFEAFLLKHSGSPA